MAQEIIDAGSGSNGVASDIGLSTWNEARTDDPAKETTNYIAAASSESAGGFACNRYFAFFDMSSIPPGSTIDSAKLVIPAASNKTTTAGGSLHIVEHVATDPIGVNDFLNYKSLNSDTSFGSLTYTSVSTGGTTDMTINATGLAYLESIIGGVAKIGLRSSFDLNNSAPSGTSQFTTNVTAFDLVVEYTPPKSGAFFNLI